MQPPGRFLDKEMRWQPFAGATAPAAGAGPHGAGCEGARIAEKVDDVEAEPALAAVVRASAADEGMAPLMCGEAA